MALTITGPDTITEGVSTATVGTDQDDVTVLSLETDDAAHSIVQIKGTTTPTGITFTPESGLNDAVIGTPADGIPLDPDIEAFNITAYQIVIKEVA